MTPHFAGHAAMPATQRKDATSWRFKRPRPNSCKSTMARTAHHRAAGKLHTGETTKIAVLMMGGYYEYRRRQPATVTKLALLWTAGIRGTC